jgi:hypothetical protein
METHQESAQLPAEHPQEQREGGAETELQAHKTFVIIVNTREKHVEGPSVTFDQLVHLAFDPVPTGPNVEFTITYRRGPAEKPEGTVAPDQTVSIKDGEIFNVTCTDRS